MTLKRQILEEYIVTRLLADEAKARGITVETLERLEVQDRILAVTEEQKRAVFESVPQTYAGKTEAEAFKIIGEKLRSIREADARRKLLANLRKKANVQVLLAPPPRDASNPDPYVGSETATVTFVEYSDFQCPFCQRAFPVVSQLREIYKDRVKFVFKDFPLSIHPQASKAAEAGSCAAEQGKFWELHQWMFQNPRNLHVADLKRAASEKGLDAKAFAQCLDGNRYEAAWRADMEEGQKLGIQATPTFVINGQLVVGAKPLDDLKKIIDQQLAKGLGTEN